MVPGRSITKTASSPNILPRRFRTPSVPGAENDPLLQDLNRILGSIKLPLNPFMTNHLGDQSKRRLREWVHERLVGAAAFPLGKRLTLQTDGDIFTLQLRGHIDFA